MTLKIRLRKQGRTNNPFYRLVVTDVENPRDGAYLENVGWYDPLKEGEKSLVVHSERVRHWLNLGAQLTDKASSLVKKVAPDVILEQTQRIVARREKERQKRKARTAKKTAA